MGAVAFALLMLAEVLLSALLFKRSLNELAQGLLTPQGMLGFAGQVLFALIPLVNGKR